jgi:hypothetical protein
LLDVTGVPVDHGGGCSTICERQVAENRVLKRTKAIERVKPL